MTRFRNIWCLFLVAALLALPGAAGAEMYVEGYLGGVQGANAGMSPAWSGTRVFSGGEAYVTSGSLNVPGRFDPAVIGGLKIGTWFVKEGFLGYQYPDWMKYLGFYIDFSFHRLNFRRQLADTRLHFVETFLDNSSIVGDRSGQSTFWSEGYAPTLAFMFAARYGFLQDSVAPFGRLQPYLAVGPGILFASQQPTINFRGTGTDNYFDSDGNPIATLPASSSFTRTLTSKSEAAICLAVDAGLRYMALKNVSIDLFFKYRFAQPSFTYNFQGQIGEPATLKLTPTYHLLSGQVGVAYHF